MGWRCKFIEGPRRKAAVSLVLLALFALPAHAQLGTPPIILVQPLSLGVQAGQTAVMSATVAPSLTPQNFHWFFNDRPVVTNAEIMVSNTVNFALDIISVLVVDNASSNNAGIYSLRITNGVGSAVSSNAILTVSSPTISIYFVTAGLGLSAGGFQIQLSGPSGSNFVIQASTDLKNWVSISTNPAPTGSVIYLDASAKTNTVRFYRAFIP